METFIADFEPISIDAWKARLQKDLKGISFEDLSSIDRNGITIQPFYTQHTADATILPIQPDWYIVDKIVVESGEESAANKQALWMLNNGASGLHLVVDALVDWTILLKSIGLEYIHLIIEVKGEVQVAINSLETYLLSSLNDTPTDSIQFLGHTDFYQFKNNAKLSIHVPIHWANNVGANATTEIAMAAAQINEALDALQQKNTLAQLQEIYISISVDTHFFEQIAKLRALRIVVANVLSAYNIKVKVHIHALTSEIYLTQADVYNNILRNTLAGMAAVLGGVDSLFITPFKVDGTDFAPRMSRNQQLLFKEESYLNQVQDTASGAYFIEMYTAEIANKAWAIFQEIEAEGGFHAAHQAGWMHKQITTQARSLIDSYKSGKSILVGVNKYVGDEPVVTSPFVPKIAWGIPFLNIENSLK